MSSVEREVASSSSAIAARMESSGDRNRVQLSQATADLLAKAGFSKMIAARDQNICVKGKGEMQTYWLRTSISIRTYKKRGEAMTTKTMATVDESSEVSDDISNEDGLLFDVDGVEGMT